MLSHDTNFTFLINLFLKAFLIDWWDGLSFAKNGFIIEINIDTFPISFLALKKIYEFCPLV